MPSEPSCFVRLCARGDACVHCATLSLSVEDKRKATMLVCVTGATSGFGAAIARRFVREGHRVIATGRRVERLEALQAELGAASVHIAGLDVRDRAAIEGFVAALPAGWTDVDVLVNNVSA